MITNDDTCRTVLLVTLWGYTNFGNRLQAIALKQMIASCGYGVVCLPYKTDVPPTTLQIIRSAIARALGRIGLGRYRRSYLSSLRSRSLETSSERYLLPSEHALTGFEEAFERDYDSYCAFVVGSDQVWHRWGDSEYELPYFYLGFAPRGKRIAYGASFGRETLPEHDVVAHKEGLLGMRHVSCRERSGCELVREASGRCARLVLDPTLCVGSKFWESVEQKPRNLVRGRYVLALFLGNKELGLREARMLAESIGADIIDLTDLHCIPVWRVDVEGFVWLVHHAAHVCTDSFHCTAFSVLFGTDFTVFKRSQEGMEQMWDRIATLLAIANLADHEYDYVSMHSHKPFGGEAAARIAPMAGDSMKWLREALHDVEAGLGPEQGWRR